MIFTEFEKWQTSLETAYKGNFARLVYGDLPEMDKITDALNSLKEHIE